MSPGAGNVPGGNKFVVTMSRAWISPHDCELVQGFKRTQTVHYPQPGGSLEHRRTAPSPTDPLLDIMSKKHPSTYCLTHTNQQGVRAAHPTRRYYNGEILGMSINQLPVAKDDHRFKYIQSARIAGLFLAAVQNGRKQIPDGRLIGLLWVIGANRLVQTLFLRDYLTSSRNALRRIWNIGATVALFLIAP